MRSDDHGRVAQVYGRRTMRLPARANTNYWVAAAGIELGDEVVAVGVDHS